jgi:hypothetical protein
MKKLNRYIAATFLTATLAAPAFLVTTCAAQDDRGVYDRDHKDYHKWDDHENAAWHRYIAEKHLQEHEFAKASSREQRDYWNWRHSHPD